MTTALLMCWCSLVLLVKVAFVFGLPFICFMHLVYTAFGVYAKWL